MMAVSPAPQADVVLANPAWPISWNVLMGIAVAAVVVFVIGFVFWLRALWLDTSKQQDKALQRYRDEPKRKADQEQKKEARRKKRLGLSAESDGPDRYWNPD
jgi:H+/gluconate symporter-like permease